MGLDISLSIESESKLRTIMEVRKLDSLKAAAEFAIKEGEWKALQIKKLLADPLPAEAWGEVFDSEYDLDKLRALEIPRLSNDAAAA